uniref:Fatty acid synthase n=1 Tax=Acrobeloides nanus TaxID=290746 RepID=A0A914CJ02_9BILA
MQHLLKNTTFHGILLDAVMDPNIGDPKVMQELVRLLARGIGNSVVQPLNRILFAKEKVEEAFRFMSQGKHVGKILIEVRQEENKAICPPSPLKIPSVCRFYCHPKHVYLITGGLGGFGLELAQWIIGRGAKKLVLTSRNGVRTGYQKRCISMWKTSGVAVEISALDIVNEEDATDLIQYCQKLGPLGGVFHLAMVLKDRVFENHTVENFSAVAAPKYFGTINLDVATRKLCDENLRWFVAFSSAVAKSGHAGQTNYSWANSAMERIIEQRREDGYPGIAIQWGAIGDVGTVLENGGDNSTILAGTLPQRIPSCLAMLDLFLAWNHPIVSSYIKADVVKEDAERGNNLLKTLAHILGVNDVSQLDMDSNLGDLGLDSLMGVEIKQALERDYNLVLSMKEIRTLTLNKLQKLVEEGRDEAANQPQQQNNDVENEGEDLADAKTQHKQQVAQIFKLRFDFRDFETKEPVVKCNQIENGPVVFFVHPIEGVWSPLKQLVSKCDFPVYCLQFVPGVPADSIESLAEYYVQEMKKIQPNGPYRIAAYSFGACIGFEMATFLQATDGNNSVESLILIDSSHLYVQSYRDAYRIAFNVSDDISLFNHPVFESELMCAVAIRCANVNYKKFRNELMQMPDFQERVQKVVDVVMEMGLIRDPESIEFGCEALRAKFIIGDKYYPTRNFKGNVTLIRSSQPIAFLGVNNTLGEDYGLSQVADKVDVHIVDGDHDSIVQGQANETAALIRDVIYSKNKTTQVNSDAKDTKWTISTAPVYNLKN